jgi:hypothetical protein
MKALRFKYTDHVACNAEVITEPSFVRKYAGKGPLARPGNILTLRLSLKKNGGTR